MKLIKKVSQMSAFSDSLRKRGRRIGFVPTMGALHEGHLSLIRRAQTENDLVVSSVFVNPTQFGPKEDFRRYPRNLKKDMKLAAKAGCDVIFAPSAGDMYPEGYSSFIDVGSLGDKFEGFFRPGHFRGVATVVAKLFGIVHPRIAYFGQKDYQQALIIERMACDLNVALRIKIMPTVRETDGLAMSSRNVYLDKSQRKQAAFIFRALSVAKARILEGERSPYSIEAIIRKVISTQPSFKIDYVAVVDASSLNRVRRLQGKVALLVAARIGPTRLIDNFLVDVP